MKQPHDIKHMWFVRTDDYSVSPMMSPEVIDRMMTLNVWPVHSSWYLRARLINGQMVSYRERNR